MSHDKIGPKELALREARERNFLESQAKMKKPSTSELRSKIAAIKPKVRKKGRGR